MMTEEDDHRCEGNIWDVSGCGERSQYSCKTGARKKPRATNKVTHHTFDLNQEK